MIIVLCGKSCVGKDSIRNWLISDKGYNRLISYTSRPQRPNEINGVDYWFVDKSELDDMRNDNLILDYREYKVSNGDIWGYGHYRYPKEFFKNSTYIAIADLDGAETFKKTYGDDCIVIYIEANIKVREQRAFIRNDNEKEVQRRFKQDDIDFSNEKLYNIIDFSIENEEGYLGGTVDEITNYIENIRKEN